MAPRSLTRNMPAFTTMQPVLAARLSVRDPVLSDNLERMLADPTLDQRTHGRRRAPCGAAISRTR